MKVKILYVLVVIAGLSQIAFAQKEMSESAKAITEEIKVGNTQSILDAGKSGDKTVVPYLITLASKGLPWAQMALAKLGEEKYLNQILAEVDAENPGVQDRAMEKLAYVGGRTAFNKFFELLDDTSPRENPRCKEDIERFEEFPKTQSEVKYCGFCCDVIFFDRSTTVISVLHSLLKDYSDIPPRYLERNPHPERWRKEQIVLWKAWFEKHKELIQ